VIAIPRLRRAGDTPGALGGAAAVAAGAATGGAAPTREYEGIPAAVNDSNDSNDCGGSASPYADALESEDGAAPPQPSSAAGGSDGAAG
jgi:hypothetical protein